MKYKVKKIAILTVGYLLTVLLFAVIFTGVTLTFLQHQAFTPAKYTSVIARAFLLPYSTFSPKYSFFKLWNEGLILSHHSGNFYRDYQLFENIFKEKKVLTENEINQIQTDLDTAQQSSQLFSEALEDPKGLTRLALTLSNKNIETLQQWNNATITAVQLAETLLLEYQSIAKSSEPKRYLVLFQNNMELRPSGGFMGSYAEVTFDKGVLQTFEVQDIYVPDGQLQGHVDPPAPIQQAFQQGFWKLRDANWHPDFARTADNVEWFYEQAMHRKIDGVIAINFSTIEQIAHLLGPIYLPDYNQTIAPDQLYTFLQSEVETDFFPGSTKKKDLLSSLSRQFFIQLQQLPATYYLQLMTIISDELDAKNIQFHFDNESVQELLAKQSVTGTLQNNDCGENCFNDYFSVFEANLGVNKANCCVERKIIINKTSESNELLSTIHMEYYNPGPPSELEKLAGDYKSFVRVYFPSNTQIQSLTINDTPYSEYVQQHQRKAIFTSITPAQHSFSNVQGLNELGLWVYVPVKETINVKITTTHSLVQDQYAITIQKQSGITDKFNHHTVQYNQSTLFTGNLTKDLLLTQE